MQDFITLRGICNDIMNVVRGSQVVQSEPISMRLLENYVNQYRSLLLKQEWDKKKYISADWQQEIQGLELEEVDSSEDSTLSTEYKLFRTKIQLPRTITHNWGEGFLYIGTITGQPIQFTNAVRSIYQQYNKWTSKDRIAYLKDRYLYVVVDKELRYLTVRILAEVPTEVSNLTNPNELQTDATEDTHYPIPIAMLPILKRMILEQELGIMAQAPSDVTNESASKIESPLSADVSYTNRATR